VELRIEICKKICSLHGGTLTDKREKHLLFFNRTIFGFEADMIKCNMVT